MKKEQQMVANFVKDRPILEENNQDPNRMANLLLEEVREAMEVLDDPVELGRELADIVFFTLSIANMKGIDMEEEFCEKVAYNLARYNAIYFQEGDYDEARARVKREERDFVKRDFYGIDA